QPDDWVDRPEVQARQRAQLTGTNRPRAWLTHLQILLRVHCAVPGLRPGKPNNSIGFPAAIAKGKHPVPFRTRKLSSSAPMVLRGRPRGRAGHRRNTHSERGSTHIGSSLFLFIWLFWA